MTISSTGVPTSSGAPTSTGAPDTTAATTSNSATSTTSSSTSAATTAETTGDPVGTTAAVGVVELTIEPKQATITIASGWSHPAQFTVLAKDGDGVPVAVDATWTTDDPALGEITRHGGTYQARNTKTGTAMVTVEAAGLMASAAVTVDALGDFPSCPPRPPFTDEAPAPGKFVRVVAPEYQGTGVFHGVYLPPDWEPGKKWPVIVESPCNKYGAFTGKVEDATLGYYLAGCRSFVWIVVPYIQAGANLDYGWGDVPAAVAYWRTNVARALDAYGGDPGAVIVAGFSRGAIGTSYVGLQTPDIADVWLGFFDHSHADVVSNLTPDMGAGSAQRMMRAQGRASLLSWGAAGDGGMTNSLKGVDLLSSFGYPVATLAVPNVGHTDVWMASDAASRKAAQTWLFDNLAARTGTHTIRGRVVDGDGAGVADATITSGARSVRTDAVGHYALRGLIPGQRAVACAHPILTCSAGQVADVTLGDADDIDFMATP